MALKSKNELLPFITDELIENQVNEDLRKYMKAIGRPLTFPVFPEEMITKLWNVEVEFVEKVTSSDGEVVLACFSPAEKKVYINVSLPGNDGRTSFTLAHEMGHVSLHNYLSKIGENRTLCRGALTSEEEAKMLERQADKYASMLLMPHETIMGQLSEKGYVGTQKLDLSVHAETLMKYFGVSHQALEMRLKDLGVVVTGGLYNMSPKKVSDRFFEDKELERETWDMRKRGRA